MELTRLHVEALRAVCRRLRTHQLWWDSQSGMLVGSAPVTADLQATLDLLIKAGVLDDQVELNQQPVAWSGITSSTPGVIGIELPVTKWANGEYVVYRNLAALIGRGDFLTEVPTHCYLIDEDVLLPEEDGDARIANYQRAVTLGAILAANADHADRSAGHPRLVFLHKVSLVIPIDYTVEDMSGPVAGLDVLQELLASDEHKQQKRSILKATLHDLLSGEPVGQRFRTLLRRVADLECQFRERYQMFVSEFDFEEVREELEEKQRDYLARLNDAFHDLGAKLFSVPLAFYLALTNFDPLPATGSPFETLVQNSVVAFAVLLVCDYVLMLLNSHRQTVDATSTEYTALLDRWQQRLKFPEQKAQVEQTRTALDRRRRRVIRYLRATRTSVILTVVVTLGLYLMRLFRAESALWDWLRSVWQLVGP